MYCIFPRILGQNTAFTNLKARYNVLFKGEGKCLNQACCNISLEDSLQLGVHRISNPAGILAGFCYKSGTNPAFGRILL